MPCLVRGQQGQEGETAPLWAGRLSLHRQCPCERLGNMACSYQIFIYLFLIERQFLYNIVLVSAIHQYESAIGVHMSPPS